MPRKFKLTSTQARILISIIVILMATIAIESAYIIYLKYQKSSYRVEIVKIRPPRIETPKPTPTTETTPVKPPPVYEKEKFDYEKLISESALYIPNATPISVFVLSSKDALKLIRSQNRPFIITRIDDDQYSVLFEGDVEVKGLVPQKRAYGVYVVTYTISKLAEDKAKLLRERGYPAYVRRFNRGGKDYFSTVIGALPDLDTAREFLRKLNWDEIKSVTGVRREGYAGWVAP